MSIDFTNAVHIPLGRWRYLEIKEEVYRFVQERECWCYGAGFYAKRFYDYCLAHGLAIHGFIVSDDQSLESEYLSDKPIRHLKDILANKDNLNIVVCVRGGIQSEIQRNLNDIIDDKNVRYMRNFPFFMVEWFDEEMERRSNLDLFDYKELSKEFYFLTRERQNNAIYGQGRLIKDIYGYPKDVGLPDMVVHTPMDTWYARLGPNIIDDLENRYGNIIYVAADYFGDYLRRVYPHKRTVTTGLLIQYAHNLLSPKDFKEKKKELGRVLLVFPIHSSLDVVPKYDTDSFIMEIQNRAVDFDSVIVCLYFRDFHFKLEKPYLDAGFHITTAGWDYDYNFLNRQRTLIELSDMTMTNGVGTHLPYTICLNKPQYIFRQDYGFEDQSVGTIYDLDAIEKGSEITLNRKNDNMFNKEIKDIFYNWQTEVTLPQKNFIKKYFGNWDEKLSSRDM